MNFFFFLGGGGPLPILPPGLDRFKLMVLISQSCFLAIKYLYAQISCVHVIFQKYTKTTLTGFSLNMQKIVYCTSKNSLGYKS